MPNNMDPSTVGPKDRVEVLVLDLGDLDQIPKAVEDLKTRHKAIDILVNNAGVGFMSAKQTTKQGHEIQFGTNHLGHFKFTSHMMGLLKASEFKPARIVSVASVAHEWSQGLDFTDLNWEKRKFAGQRSYADAKLANVYFMYGMIPRLEAAGLADAITVVSLQPGYAASQLYRHGFGFRMFTQVLGTHPANLAINEVYAAVNPELKSGDYSNPARMKFWGPPVKGQTTEVARNPDHAKTLWELSEKLIQEPFQF